MNFIEQLAHLAEQQRSAINNILYFGFTVIDENNELDAEKERRNKLFFEAVKISIPAPRTPILPNMDRLFLYRNVIVSAEMLTVLLRDGSYPVKPELTDNPSILNQVVDAIQTLLQRKCQFIEALRVFAIIDSDSSTDEDKDDLPDEENDVRGIVGLLQKVFGGKVTVLNENDLVNSTSEKTMETQPPVVQENQTVVNDISDLPTMSMDTEGFLNINLSSIKGIKIIGEGKPLTINFDNCHLGIVGDGAIVVKSNTEKGGRIHLNPCDPETNRPLSVEETIAMDSAKNGMSAIKKLVEEPQGNVIDLANKIDQPDAIRFMCKYILCDLRKEITAEQARTMPLNDLLSNPAMSKFFDMKTLKLTKQGSDLFNVLNRTRIMEI
ncbi:hypothetical protein [Proteus mirabilis]|uniref:hypothetical protein n=1 Tax=Proteus mirabilis TaxID=584 RepID=UPI0034D3B567